MKKFLVFVCLAALVSFSGLAFAGERGAINPDATVVTVKAVKYEPRVYTWDLNDTDENDIVAFYANISALSADVVTPSDFVAGMIHQPTETSNRIVVMTDVTMDLEPTFSFEDKITIWFKNYTDTRTEDLYAFIKAKPEGTFLLPNYAPDKYHGFLCTVTDKNNEKVLSFDVPHREEFFSDGTENTVVIATAKTVDTSSSGGGGCNAGYAGLLLFAAVPFLFRKKK